VVAGFFHKLAMSRFPRILAGIDRSGRQLDQRFVDCHAEIADQANPVGCYQWQNDHGAGVSDHIVRVRATVGECSS
jgi:hypothetical protein